MLLLPIPADRVPLRGVAGGGRPRSSARAGQAAGNRRKADGWMIAQWRDDFQRHVAGALDGPLVVLLEQDRTNEADGGIFVWEDASDLGPALDFAVETLDRIGRVQLGPMLWRERHVASTSVPASSKKPASLGSFGRS